MLYKLSILSSLLTKLIYNYPSHFVAALRCSSVAKNKRSATLAASFFLLTFALKNNKRSNLLALCVSVVKNNKRSAPSSLTKPFPKCGTSRVENINTSSFFYHRGTENIKLFSKRIFKQTCFTFFGTTSDCYLP